VNSSVDYPQEAAIMKDKEKQPTGYDICVALTGALGGHNRRRDCSRRGMIEAASAIVSVRKGQTDGHKYALVIGNGNYTPDTVFKFPSFVQNAKDVTNALEGLDWKVCCLTDSSLNDVISVKKTFTEPCKGSKQRRRI